MNNNDMLIFPGRFPAGGRWPTKTSARPRAGLSPSRGRLAGRLLACLLAWLLTGAGAFAGPPPTHTLTVVNGAGGGAYTNGAVVAISANPAPAGQMFANWHGTPSANPAAAATTLTMPNYAVTITANYTNLPPPKFPLTVVNGTGGGNYAANAVVAIKAGTAPAGQAFAGWQGAAVANAAAAATTLTMPAAAAGVTATYSNLPPPSYPLTVVNGTGGGSYTNNTMVTITANPAPAGQAFANWHGTPTANPAAATTTLLMPHYATTVTATYTNRPAHTLMVVNGGGGGSYSAGLVVAITANPAPAGQAFSQWTGAAVANPAAAATTLTMPAVNCTVTATYTNVPTYTLTVVGGTGAGVYPAGTVVPLQANPAPAGQVFKQWTGAAVANPAAAATTLVMPAANTTVTAVDEPHFIPLAITTTNLAPDVAGTPYQAALAAVGGTPPYTWTIAAGGFPDSLTLLPNGQLTGTTPANEGAWAYAYPYRAYVTVTDAGTNTASMAFSMTLLPPTNSTYTLTVVNGSGGGVYLTNSTVAIAANPAPAGLVFVNWTGATVANPTAASTTLVMPAANTTVTANFTSVTNLPATYALTVNNGTGGGLYPAGTTVALGAGAAPAGQVFQQWTGASVANPHAANTTLVMPAAPATVTANFGFPAPAVTNVAFPVTTHPRLWVTPADLPRLQSWATSNNPVYAQGLLPLLAQAVNDYDTQFFPGGQPNPVYPDLGDTQGYQGLISEQYAALFALASLIDNDPNQRIAYAQRTRNLIMYAMNQAVQGIQSGAPFRDHLFATYNRANAGSECWPLAVDWIYNATDAMGQPILSAADKLTIRNVFLIWATQCLNASTTGGDHPAPVGVMNDPSLLPNGDAYRMAANNYYLGHARLVTLMSLALDPADDPVLDPTQVPAQLGNTLRSYILDATGAWLYQEFAMFGDHDTVCAAYNLPASASVGLASGGLPPEGMLYGHSIGFMMGQLLALKTAGFADPALSGPQVSLANNPPYWARFVQGFISSLVPAPMVPPSESYLGQVYQFASYGDILRMYATPDFAVPFGLLSLLDRQNGDLSRQNAERWFVTTAVEGGPAGLLGRVQNPWTWGVQDALLSFLLLDPAATTVPPQAGYPTSFYDPGQGRLVDRTDWSTNANLFDFRCSWISINHQQADANQFEFYRQGEWLTKGVANYDNNEIGLTTDFHNTLSLQNWCVNGYPQNLAWFEGQFWTNGSQWGLGENSGDPTVFVGVQPGYSYCFGDSTPLYNRPSVWSPNNAALDIQQANRSILWLKPDHIVIYDRATSAHAGLFKHFNLAVTAPPAVAGNVITTTTPGGQHLSITSLLPASSTLAVIPIAGTLNPIADLEPATHRLIIADPANPADTRFLHVLQGSDAGATPDVATWFASTQGTALDGAWFGTYAVLFQVNAFAAFTGATYAVPAGVVNHLVTGLVPGAAYNVSAGVNAGVLTVTVAPAATGFAADSAGVLTLAF